MTLLLRKFSKTKWEKNKGTDLNEYSADAITGCTRTKGETLSVWSVTNKDFTSQEIEKLIVAVATTMDQPATVDFILLDENELSSKGLSIKSNEGQTPLVNINQLHKDIVNINYQKLGVVSAHIVEQMEEDENTTRITRNELIKLVKKYLNVELSITDLSKKWQEKVA